MSRNKAIEEIAIAKARDKAIEMNMGLRDGQESFDYHDFFGHVGSFLISKSCFVLCVQILYVGQGQYTVVDLDKSYVTSLRF